MEIVYKRACGVDVHKSFIVAVICSSDDNNKSTYIRKRFSTFNNSLISFRNWLLDNDCLNVCMESTGKYYIPVFNALENFIPNVVVTNPKWVKAIKGHKDDNKDAKWIVDLFKLGLVRSSFIPPKDIRILRECTRYSFKITNNRSSEKNRFTNALTVGNCKLDMVFNDVFGKSSSRIIDTILSDNSYSDDYIISLVHGRCKSSKEDILNSISGLDLNYHQKSRISLIEEHIAFLNNTISKIDSIINDIVVPYESIIEQLCSISGIKRETAISIISEIGVDMSQFSSHFQLVSWAGLAPGCNESAGKKKSVKISRAGVYLKPYLIEAAHSAVKHPYFAFKFSSISKRRGKKRAYVAIARKILVCIYHMLITGELFNPSDLSSVETSPKFNLKFTKNNFLQSAKQLVSLGLTSDQLLDLIASQNAN